LKIRAFLRCFAARFRTAMPLTQSVLYLLGKIIPPKTQPFISPELVAQHEPRFKRIYRRHTLIGLLVLFAIPGLLYLCSGFLESIWYIKQPDALFLLTPEKGLLGLALGMMLGFGISVPLVHWIIKGQVGADIMEIYDVWYDERPHHRLDSRLLARGLFWIFIPLTLWTAAYFRYDYTVVTTQNMRFGNPWRLSQTTVSLHDIRAVEMQIGKIAPNGDYKPGFRYRIRFQHAEPWESPFFAGSLKTDHLRYEPMVQHILNATGLEMVEVATRR